MKTVGSVLRRIRAERMDEMNTATMRAEALSTRLLGLVDVAEPRLREVSEPERTEPILTGGWSRKQVIGHLIDSASNNHQRFVRAAVQASWDFPGYDQNGRVRVHAVQDADWPLLVWFCEGKNRPVAQITGHSGASHLETACRIGA